MRRLYLQIYAAFLIIIALFALFAALVWRFAPRDAEPNESLLGMSALVSRWLPTAQRPQAEQQAALEQLARWFRVEATLRAPDGTLIARVGRAMPAPSDKGAARESHPRGGGPHVALVLADGRSLSAHARHPRWPKRALGALALLAGAVALGAYPIARRIARRLERLQTQVESLGQGTLSARVEVRGNDEIARLAASFNQSAAQIEKLVNAQRATLAAASHELRSPLARIRLGIELLQGEARADVRERLSKDIAELDDLVGELLLASRLDAIEHVDRNETLDLLGLLAEEASRFAAPEQKRQIEVSGEPVQVQGDARMLRRLVRNLLENALRYGGGTRIDAQVERAAGGGGALIRVTDRGPGVPEAEREKIFQPFYRLAGTAEQGSGAGLGLALVRQIARRHGGDAHCLAREGGGTRIEVKLA